MYSNTTVGVNFLTSGIKPQQTVSQGNDLALLATSALSYDYRGIAAVHDCSLTVPQGKIVALIGANGAGKTTSVKMIAGALRPASGRIAFEGEDITGIAAHRAVNLGVALIPEGRLVFQHLTVLENLLVSGNCRRGRPKRNAPK